jgi:hypothetical protein
MNFILGLVFIVVPLCITIIWICVSYYKSYYHGTDKEDDEIIPTNLTELQVDQFNDEPISRKKKVLFSDPIIQGVFTY